MPGLRFSALLIIVFVIAVAAFLFRTRIPVHWEATYPNASFVKVADCLATKAADTYTVKPETEPAAHKARVILYERGTIKLVGEYEVKQNGAGTSITWRDVLATTAADTAVDQQTRDRADSCGKSS